VYEKEITSLHFPPGLKTNKRENAKMNIKTRIISDGDHHSDKVE